MKTAPRLVKEFCAANPGCEFVYRNYTHGSVSLRLPQIGSRYIWAIAVPDRDIEEGRHGPAGTYLKLLLQHHYEASQLGVVHLWAEQQPDGNFRKTLCGNTWCSAIASSWGSSYIKKPADGGCFACTVGLENAMENGLIEISLSMEWKHRSPAAAADALPPEPPSV